MYHLSRAKCVSYCWNKGILYVFQEEEARVELPSSSVAWPVKAGMTLSSESEWFRPWEKSKQNALINLLNLAKQEEVVKSIIHWG